MFDLTTNAEQAIRRLLEAWWRAQGAEETGRKATSVELSGVLPDGTKYAIKEYAANSDEAYRIAGTTLARLQQDHTK